MDEFINLFGKPSMKQTSQKQNIYTPDYLQFISNSVKQAAIVIKKQYDAYIEVGFTAEQAFELIKINITRKG